MSLKYSKQTFEFCLNVKNLLLYKMCWNLKCIYFIINTKLVYYFFKSFLTLSYQLPTCGLRANVFFNKQNQVRESYKPGACLDIFQKGFTKFFVLYLPLKYAYLRYALPVKYALCVLRKIYPKKSVFKMLFTA